MPGPKAEPDWTAYSAVAPPPSGPGGVAAPSEVGSATMGSAEPPPVPAQTSGASGYEFDAEMDASELNEKDLPGPTWTARGRRLSRSSLTIRTRRMCYAGRRLLLAVHMIDSHPVPLFGIVRECAYESEGLYQVHLDLLPVPDKSAVTDWLQEICKSG